MGHMNIKSIAEEFTDDIEHVFIDRYSIFSNKMTLIGVHDIEWGTPAPRDAQPRNPPRQHMQRLCTYRYGALVADADPDDVKSESI